MIAFLRRIAQIESGPSLTQMYLAIDMKQAIVWPREQQEIKIIYLLTQNGMKNYSYQ